MQDRSRVLPPWRTVLQALLAAAACALLLLSAAGWVYLLVRQRHLAEELRRLDAQLGEVSRRCGVQEEAAELRVLQRSRRQESGTAAATSQGQEEDDDVMVMMTYSLVPVRQQISFSSFAWNSLLQVVLVCVKEVFLAVFFLSGREMKFFCLQLLQLCFFWNVS